jgi:SAM-dependent methyltransferase
MRQALVSVANKMLSPFGVKLTRLMSPETDRGRPWDRAFLGWIARAKALGKDPNEIGDEAWDANPLHAMERYVFPHIHGNSVVLELGPGTGRATRHVISRCGEIIAVDYSKVVCDWLREYLRGKGKFRVLEIDRPRLESVASESVDFVFAYGVFEHIDLDDMFCFLEEFQRVLKPGGVIWFNFDTLMTDAGLQWFTQYRERLKPGEPCVFRFHHPDVVHRLAQSAGLHPLEKLPDNGRFAFLYSRKPVD